MTFIIPVALLCSIGQDFTFATAVLQWVLCLDMYFPLQSYNGFGLAFYTFYCNSNMESVKIYFG